MYRTFSGQCDSRKEASVGRMVLEQKQTRATASAAVSAPLGSCFVAACPVRHLQRGGVPLER